jgi:NAD(P)-dependent dehydrogenase (short-subunit alcohol dehydrogenase family)
MAKLLDGKVAMITGASQGIGEATARRMVEEGARVVLFDLNGEAARALAADLGDRALAVEGDVSSEEDVARAVAAGVERFGALDVLHNNAAMTSSNTDPGKDQTVETLEVAYWDRMFAVNCRGPMLCCKYAFPHMRRAGKGSIVNMSSIDALMGDRSRTAYGASKSALTAFTMAVATQGAQHGIRCNAVAPAMTLSPLVRTRFGERLEKIQSHYLMPIADPSQQASVIAFLASDESSYISGVVLRVDGGLLAHAPWYSDGVI